MKSKLFFLFILLSVSFANIAFAQEEEETEEPTTTISKAEQKKLQKEAAGQTKPSVNNAATSPRTAAPAANSTAATKPASTNATPMVSGGNAGNLGSNGAGIGRPVFSSINKSTDPKAQYSNDSTQQGNFNLYRPLQDTSWVGPKNLPQARDFASGANPYPAKPRDMVEIGLNVGIPFLASDLPYKLFLFNSVGTTYGIGGSIRKSLGYVFSVRASLNHGTTFGDGWKGTSAIFNNRSIMGNKDYDVNVNYYEQVYNKNPIFLNYKMTYTEGSFVGMINLNNIRFHKERPKFSPYLLVGASLFLYNTKINQLDADGKMYDYSIPINAATNTSGTISRARNEIELYKLWDGSFESQAEQDQITFKKGNFRYRMNPSAKFGAGISYRINRNLSLSLESSNTISGDDLLDGQRWQEHPAGDPALSPNPDVLNYTSIGFNFSLGKNASEPLWWLNPLDQSLVELNETKNKLAKIPEFTDSDDDGVIDVLDREPNTPEGANVDTHGVAIDSDKDGIIDLRDKEPFSIPGARVDGDGVGMKKQGEMDIDSLVAMVKAAVKNGGGGIGGGGSFPGWYLPMIHFDLDKDFVKPDYYPDLYHIAQAMKMYPKMKVFIDGHTDIRNSNKYNEDLSRRRAINVRNFLIKNYGIEESRLMLRYLGETTNLIQDLPDRFDPRYEREQYMNRRVEFTIDLDSMKE